MKMSLAALLLGTLALVGCGSSPTKASAAVVDKPAAAVAVSADPQATTKPKTKADLAKSKRANCEKYTPIGSNRPQYRCLTPAEKAAESEANEREMRKNSAPPGGGN